MLKKLFLPVMICLLILSGCYSEEEYKSACEISKEEGYKEGYEARLEELKELNDPDTVYCDIHSEEFTMKDLTTIMEEGYDQGYDIGYDDGYDDGISDGYDDGYDEGYEVGETAATAEFHAAEKSSMESSSASVSEDSSSTTSTDTQSITVYVTNTGSKYHMNGCQYLRQSQNAISLSSAKAAGYTPCSRCHPPQ